MVQVFGRFRRRRTVVASVLSGVLARLVVRIAVGNTQAGGGTAHQRGDCESGNTGNERAAHGLNVCKHRHRGNAAPIILSMAPRHGLLELLRERKIGTEIFVTIATTIAMLGREYVVGAVLMVIILIAELIAELRKDRPGTRNRRQSLPHDQEESLRRCWRRARARDHGGAVAMDRAGTGRAHSPRPGHPCLCQFRQARASAHSHPWR